MPVAGRRALHGAEFKNILAEAFRKAGWRIRRNPAAGELRADLCVEKAEHRYAIEVKSASEGRRDRLIPLLSQAILQVQAFVLRFPEQVSPLAVVASRRVPASVADQIQQFAQLHAPDVAVGVIDGEGFRSFAGPGLEGLDARPRRSAIESIRPPHLPDLFSDLNQWMLKILLGQQLPEALIFVPREPIRHASQLAVVAGVSVMSASRLVHQLGNEGFLGEDSISDRSRHLQIVRTDELLQRWVSAGSRMSRDIPARWILRKDSANSQRQ